MTIQKLDAFLSDVRKQRHTFKDGLHLAINYVNQHDGDIRNTKDGVELRLDGETATCLQLFPDIDRFYYEN